MRFEDQDYCNSEISHLDLYKGKGYGAHEVGTIKELLCLFPPWFLIILLILFITFYVPLPPFCSFSFVVKYFSYLESLEIAYFIFPLLQMKTFL